MSNNSVVTRNMVLEYSVVAVTVISIVLGVGAVYFGNFPLANIFFGIGAVGFLTLAIGAAVYVIKDIREMNAYINR